MARQGVEQHPLEDPALEDQAALPPAYLVHVLGLVPIRDELPLQGRVTDEPELPAGLSGLAGRHTPGEVDEDMLPDVPTQIRLRGKVILHLLSPGDGPLG
jgi:hypothetical protein